MPPRAASLQVQLDSPLDRPAGGAAHARGLARALRRAGVRLSVLCTGWDGPPESEQFGRIIAVRPRNLPLLWRRPPLGTLPFWLGAIRKHAGGLDAIVALSAEMALASQVARPRTPTVYCPAALLGCEHPADLPAALQRCERRAFRGAAGVVYPAEAVRTAVEGMYGPLNVPAAVCPLGVDVAQVGGRGELRASRAIPPDAFVLLTVGPLNKNKGQALIARALADAAPPDWWWVVVGDGPDRPALEAVLRSTGLGQRTVLAGAVPGLADWYAAADVLVCASRCETFGLAIAEALAAGLPVVLPRNRPGSTLSPLAEPVAANRLGRTFERERPATLRAALAELAADPRQRAQMAMRARAFAAGRFSWERYAALLLDLTGVMPGRP